MPESIAVNGTDLSTLVRNVEDLAGLLRSPVRRGEGLVVPRRHGSLLTKGRSYDAGELVLPMWVIGADAATGANLVGDAAVASFYARADELLALFHAYAVTITHTLPSGAGRQTTAEVSEVVEFTRQLGSPLFGRVAVALTLPDAFWQDVSTTSQTITGATGTGGSTHSLTNFAGATAPMDRLTLTFTGAINNPVLTDVPSGRWIAYDGVITAGQTLVVDCATWGPLVGTGGLTASQTSRRSSHAGRWFELTPGSPPLVKLVHSTGSNASVTIAGRRHYLTG